MIKLRLFVEIYNLSKSEYILQQNRIQIFHSLVWFQNGKLLVYLYISDNSLSFDRLLTLR